MEFKKPENPLIVLIAVGIVYTFLLAGVLSGFKGLPGPLFGGDLYYQLGAITHDYYVAPWEWAGSSNGIGERPAYFILYSSLVTIFGKILGLAPMQAMFSFEYFLPIAALLATYFLFRKLFDDAWLALLGVLLTVSYASFPLFKYTVFTQYVIVPLFLCALYLFYKEQDRNSAIALGLAYGAMGLSHSTAFLFASGAIAVIFVYLIYKEYREKHKETGKFALTKEYLVSKKWFVAAFALGFVISQVYWFAPLFVFHGQAQLGSHLWSTEDFGNPSVQWTFFFDTLKGMFVNTYGLLQLAVSLLSLGGLVLLLKGYKGLKEHEIFILVLFLFTFALTFSYFITMPLLGTNFVPGYISGMYLKILTLAVCLVAVKHAVGYAGKNGWLVLAVLFALWAFNSVTYYDTWRTGLQYWHPDSPLPEMYASLQGYLLNHSDVHDVVLTANEVGFMINALTGRELMLSRRAHNDPFVDFDRYQMDGAIILYGNDKQKKVKLMKKYNVKYLYVDGNWPSMEWQIQNGSIVGYSDPILLFYSEGKEKELLVNGIKYVRLNGWVDPSVRGFNVKTYDLLIVSPDNYDWSGKGPWKNDIDDMLTEVWSYDYQNQKFAALYKVAQ